MKTKEVKEAKAWYIKFPLDVYAMGPIRFENPLNEKEVKEYARQFEGCSKLPRGFQCWITNDKNGEL